MNAHRLMKVMGLGAACVMLLWGTPSGARGEGSTTQLGSSPHVCSDCHFCPKPTASAWCLKPFPLEWTRRTAAIAPMHPQDGPAVARMDALEKLYEPVLFDHLRHAEMAEVGEGCVACHHYTPNGASHPPCRDCHGAQATVQMAAEPGLKGAYHRRCMGCHREWSGQDACEMCHLAKATVAARGPGYSAGALRRCQEPTRKVYETPHKGTRFVTFFHVNHSRHYGLTCSECHRQDACVACHYQGEKPVAVVQATADAMHHKCAACHDIQTESGCTKCHAKGPKTAFSHVEATGWDLQPHHILLTCASCHPENKRIARIDRACDSCHGDWEPGNFNHAVVGLELSEDHSDLDCKDCHLDRRFEKPPACKECHDEKRYPRDLPGERVDRADVQKR